MVLEPHSTFGFSLLLSGSDCPLCSVLFLVDSLTSLSCIYAAFCSGGRRHLLAPPGKDEKNFMYQKNDDCHNHRLCAGNSGCAYAGEFKCRNDLRITHRFLSFRWFVGLLTYPFMCRQFFCTSALLQPSRGAMTALPMTGFHRAQISLHGKQYFRNTATLGNPLCFV